MKGVNVPNLSHYENWLDALLASSDMLGINKDGFAVPNFELPQHRFEKIRTIQGITFYNDSKSTITQSTIAAVQQLKNERIHLFLGGLIRGRSHSIYQRV